MNQDIKSNKTLVITHVFDAPLELVWRAWTTPEQIARWFNSEPGQGVNVRELDVRPGGRFRFAIPSPDGGMLLGEYTGTYLTVKPPRELEFKVVDFSITNDPAGGTATFKVELETVGNQTKLCLTATELDESYHKMTIDALNACFDKLAESLK